jgi:ubiquinone/menaquinone biosynthesis C-methylase UbiE
MRCYAYLFDFNNAPAERAGLAKRRHDLLAMAAGSTIEIGAGTGLNLRHFPPAVTRLVLVEPGRDMRHWLGRRVAKTRASAEVVDAVADRLPFADATFDTAVVTFTLCSVPDAASALAEIARVLVPGGHLLFMEHVRSADPAVAARQDQIPFPYSLIGCRPNRDTLRVIESSEFIVQSVRVDEVPGAPEIERPMISGVARRPV